MAAQGQQEQRGAEAAAGGGGDVVMVQESTSTLVRLPQSPEATGVLPPTPADVAAFQRWLATAPPRKLRIGWRSYGYKYDLVEDIAAGLPCYRCCKAADGWGAAAGEVLWILGAAAPDDADAFVWMAVHALFDKHPADVRATGRPVFAYELGNDWLTEGEHPWKRYDPGSMTASNRSPWRPCGMFQTTILVDGQGRITQAGTDDP